MPILVRRHRGVQPQDLSARRLRLWLTHGITASDKARRPPRARSPEPTRPGGVDANWATTKRRCSHPTHHTPVAMLTAQSLLLARYQRQGSHAQRLTNGWQHVPSGPHKLTLLSWLLLLQLSSSSSDGEATLTSPLLLKAERLDTVNGSQAVPCRSLPVIQQNGGWNAGYVS